MMILIKKNNFSNSFPNLSNLFKNRFPNLINLFKKGWWIGSNLEKYKNSTKVE